MQREVIILIGYFCYTGRVGKTYIENVSELIAKGKMRLHWLARTDLSESVAPFTSTEIASFWEVNEYWYKACNFFLKY